MVKGVNQNYKFFETTGDVGVYIYGKDLEELFKNGGKVLFKIITNVREKGSERKEIVLSSENLENLFIKWLNELIFLFDVYGLVACDFDIKLTQDENNNFRLNVLIYYYPFDEKNDEKKLLIKAATYHKFYIKKTANGYEARVLFDI